MARFAPRQGDPVIRALDDEFGRSRSPRPLGGGVPEQHPLEGQLVGDWLRQELGRGRSVATQSMNRFVGPEVIKLNRLAALFFQGSNWRARQFLQHFRV